MYTTNCFLFIIILICYIMHSGYYIIGELCFLSRVRKKANILSGIPFGLWLTFSCQFGLKGTWIGLNTALVYISLGSLFVCMRSDWNRELKKVQERLVANQKANGT
jgi:Na+-driven multidrug efflux pump